MIALVDNPVELIGLIELIRGLPKGVCRAQGSVILNQPTNLSAKQSTISGGYKSHYNKLIIQ